LSLKILAVGATKVHTITVTDSAGNVSNTLEITSFTVDTSLRVFVGVGNGGIS